MKTASANGPRPTPVQLIELSLYEEAIVANLRTGPAPKTSAGGLVFHFPAPGEDPDLPRRAAQMVQDYAAIVKYIAAEGLTTEHICMTTFPNCWNAASWLKRRDEILSGPTHPTQYHVLVAAGFTDSRRAA